MSSDTVTIRTGTEIKAVMARLVEEGTYRSITEFVVEAILLKLDLEGIAVEVGAPPPDLVAASFASPRGRALIGALVREEVGR